MDKRKPKPTLLPVDDLPSSSSDDEQKDAKQVVSDSNSEESYEEFGEDEIDEDHYEGLALDENELSESDVDLSSSEDEILVIKEKLEKKKAKRQQSSSDDDEESKEPKDVSQLVKKNPEIISTREAKNNELQVNFELVQPSEAYYHQVKALLLRYLDGEAADSLDIIPMTEHICERTSIGQVVASPLEPDEDPEQMPEFKGLSDEEFAKVAVKYNSQRDVFGFSTILSLTFKPKTSEKPKFLSQILDYVNEKAKKYCAKARLSTLQTILGSKNVGLLMAERVVNLPVDLVPSMHTELPDDLEFTKAQDDIADPKEFNYKYLLVISRFTRGVDKETKRKFMEQHESSGGNLEVFKSQKLDESAERRFYKWEDNVLLPEAVVSFEFLTTFTDIDAEGKKVTYQGNRGESETQYRLVYLIEYKRYVEKIQGLASLVKA